MGHQGAAANWSSPSCHVKCPSYCCQAILIMEEAKARPMAIPKHIGQEDPSIMSFSPSKMTTQTLDHFSQSENEGVPLQTAWTFWLDKAVHNASLSEYKANIRKIYSVSTVQGFWSVFNHIPDVSELRLRSYYHLMRDEREPVWEELLLAAIGEQFMECLAPGDDICGLSVSPREKDDLIQIWNKDKQVEPESHVLEKVHQLVPDVRFNAEFYKPHETHSAFGKKN